MKIKTGFMRRILLITALLPTLAICSFNGCNRNGGLSGISPARNLEGTWMTVLTPPTIYYYCDVCGSYTKVAKTQIGMQWIVTRTGDNTVDIQVNRTSASAVQLMTSQGCALYVPLAFPLFLAGEISSSQLTLRNGGGTIVGSFSFTTSNMTGDFNSNFERFCGVYCSGAGTDPQTVVLVKQ